MRTVKEEIKKEANKTRIKDLNIRLAKLDNNIEALKEEIFFKRTQG